MKHICVWMLLVAVAFSSLSVGCNRKPRRAGTMKELPSDPLAEIVVEDIPLEEDEPPPPDDTPVEPSLEDPEN